MDGEDAFLTIDGQALSLQQAVGLLASAGRLGDLVGEMVRQFVLERELAERPELDPSPAMVRIAIEAFRAERDLADDAQLREWLAVSGKEHGTFVEGVVRELRVERLSRAVTEGALEAHFLERKAFLDRVALSRIVAGSREEALELLAGQRHSCFETLAPVRTMDLPAPVPEAIRAAEAGALLGPFELAPGWTLLRVDRLLPAALDDDGMRDGMRRELFESWLAERMEGVRVELAPGS